MEQECDEHEIFGRLICSIAKANQETILSTAIIILDKAVASR